MNLYSKISIVQVTELELKLFPGLKRETLYGNLFVVKQLENPTSKYLQYAARSLT